MFINCVFVIVDRYEFVSEFLMVCNSDEVIYCNFGVSVGGWNCVKVIKDDIFG